MANAKSRSFAWYAVVAATALAALCVAAWASPYGVRLRGDAMAGTAYGARVACSCRFVAGRSLADCGKDTLAGMGMIRFAADEEAKSVTASVPLIASDTARYRQGYGCVLQPWRDRDA